MKRLLVSLLLLVPALAAAQTAFPGLKSVLSEDEWRRAGLDRLSPDQVGVIDAALIRHLGRVYAQHPPPAAPAPGESRPASVSAPAGAPRGWLERFGLPVFEEAEWKSLPPLRAKVVAWETPNRFRLDNGQVWEGLETITYELVDREIEIWARPARRFALSVDGQPTTIRVQRVR